MLGCKVSSPKLYIEETNIHLLILFTFVLSLSFPVTFQSGIQYKINKTLTSTSLAMTNLNLPVTVIPETKKEQNLWSWL